MNQQGRDELRAKHTPSKTQDDWTMCPYCRVSGGCDTIRVLDAWEEWLNSRTQMTPPVDAQK